MGKLGLNEGEKANFLDSVIDDGEKTEKTSNSESEKTNTNTNS